MPDDLNLSNLKPAQARNDRKRIGRGQGSGKGRYSGRGLKGQKSRSGSHKMRPGFEGGQNPLYMRLGKQRGPYSKDAMPMGPHRTQTQPVNVATLEDRFDAGADVTLEALVEKGLIKNTKIDVKLLGQGDLSKKLSVTVHAASASAREKIEAAGGSLTLLREPKERLPKRKPQSARPALADEPEQEEPQAEAEETGPEAEGEPDPEPPPEGEEG
jgi:large subunit ribosomal protein L15